MTISQNKTPVKLRIGGVPEHFNAPWQLDTTKAKLNDAGIEVEWQNFPGGTGAMCKALGSNEVDAALLLTEGAVVYASNNSDIQLYGVYVQSPLVWGIHVGAQSNLKSLDDLRGKSTFAISRFGSGSHLMSYVLGDNLGWNVDAEMKFEVIQNLEGARKALPLNDELVFMWEKVMTAPFVDNGEFNRIGTCPTPWPCFVLAVRKEYLQKETSLGTPLIETTMQIVQEACDQFKRGGENTIDYVVEKYNVSKEGAAEWLADVEWNCTPKISKSMLEKVIATLSSLNRFEKAAPTVESICACEIIE